MLVCVFQIIDSASRPRAWKDFSSYCGGFTTKKTGQLVVFQSNLQELLMSTSIR
jgi:hypothetical protein